MKTNELRTVRNDDNSYTVRTPDGRYVGAVVRWYRHDAVNLTGVPQFRHPWGDADCLADAVREFERIPWVVQALADKCCECGQPATQRAVFWVPDESAHDTLLFCGPNCLQEFKDDHLDWTCVATRLDLPNDLRAIAAEHPLAAQRGIMEAAADEIEALRAHVERSAGESGATTHEAEGDRD